MSKKNKLSLYLIKPEFDNYEAIIEKYDQVQEIENVGIAFIGSSNIAKPNWVKTFFKEQLEVEDVFTANARLVLLVRIEIIDDVSKLPIERIFAITMGYGKNMLKDNVIEERFGLKVILNTIRPDSLRRISKSNIGGNLKLSNEQLPKKSDINDFGLDIYRDLISNIAGVSDDEEYVSGTISGGDGLYLTAEVDINGIVTFLKQTYHKYLMNSYKETFGWIDQIVAVKDSRIIEKLNSELIMAINNSDCNIWMAVPEIIDWDQINGFKYCGTEIFDDIYIEKVRDSFKSKLYSVEQLKSKRISAISKLDDSTRYKWAANKCIFGELILDDKTYCISDGKWYCIDENFVRSVNDDYDTTEVSSIEFDDYTYVHTGENSYSKSFVDTHADDFILLDANNIPYGGGRSKIELCDILSSTKDFIHIKPYQGSSTLSHLFNQALVSAELVKSDPIFVNAANEKIKEISCNLKFQINNHNDINIIFGIISANSQERPHLPFFSKVSFRHVKRRLMAYGYNVYIKNIFKTDTSYKKVS